jgi:hypothetical protein
MSIKKDPNRFKADRALKESEELDSDFDDSPKNEHPVPEEGTKSTPVKKTPPESPIAESQNPAEPQVCPKCKGSGFTRMPDGTLSPCTCFYDKQRKQYLGEQLLQAAVVPQSLLSAPLATRRNYLIDFPSPDGSMDMFSAHFRKALNDEFDAAMSNSRKPIAWKDTTMRDLVSIQYSGTLSEKKEMFITPGLLLIKTSSWPTNANYYQETEGVMTDRAGRGTPTWLVFANINKISSVEKVPSSFKDLLKSMRELNHYVLIKS